MKQDMNNSLSKALRAVFAGTLMFMTCTNAMADGVVVHGNVFGGGNQADVKINTEVNMSTGTVEGNVYGGGNLGSVGTYTTSADMKTFTFTANTGTCNVTIDNGSIGTGVSMSQDGTFANGNVYGAGKGEADTYWCEKAMVYKTNVTINGGTVNGTVYGGGQIGRVENDATVIIGVETPTNSTPAPIIAGNVFGAGAGKETHGYSALLRGDAKLTIQGNARVGLNVYGGGEEASVGRFKIVGGRPSEPDNDGSGDCTVNVRGGAVIGTNTDDNITDKGNVFGTCKGVAAPATFTAYDKEYKSMQAVVQKAPVGDSGTAWEYVEGSTDYYWEYYPTLDAYQGFLNTLALASHPVVTIGGALSNETTGAVTPSGNPTVNGSVYGGGQRGITLGTVAVNIAGGTVNQDVYGGGALADTNKGNQTAEKYDVATVTVGETAVTGMYERSGAGTDESPYVYAVTEDTKAADGKTYYTKAAQSSINTTTVNLTGGTIKGDAYGGGLGQKIGFNDAQGVIATKDVEAVVWGDINVTLGGNGGSATSFYTTYEKDNDNNDVLKSGRVFGCNNLLGSPQGDVTVTVWTTVDGKNASGGTITKTDESKKNSTTETDHTYRLAAVYGGGNLASYEALGKKAHVIIHGCSDTSILTVYGGGNAAAVPETDVDVYSAYEIGALFGGGNGKDKYKKGNTWQINPGANVNGNANSMIYGGTVHEAYGASNEKGTITGDVAIDVSSVNSDNCPLDVAKIVGAGKNADVFGDLVLIMGCKPDTQIPLVYGGADNANVNGNVELTITSGKFGKVFGGNNETGAIRGHIKLNIEETGTCDTPIEIDELYLGGNEAAYSMYGYYVKTKSNDPNATLIGAFGETADLNPTNGKLIFLPRLSVDDSHLPVNTYSYDETNGWTWTTYPITGNGAFVPYAAPVLNVISCTRIGAVFGGGLGETAIMCADPTVNINMEPGALADKIDRDGTTGADNDPNLLGEIGGKYTNDKGQLVDGGVYGGGNAAAVYGTTTVNIGTETEVQMTSIKDETTGELLAPASQPKHTVTGAYIVGNVYGGGNEADVTGNTFVNICAKYDDVAQKYLAVSQGTTGVLIGGDVFGGGKGKADTFTCEKAMIGTNDAGLNADYADGNTNVVIGNGTINGTVYGGGQIGRVERNTTVTIGLGDGKATGTPTSAPEIKGNVYGAGAGEEEHGYAALVRGNPTVTIQGNAKVGKSVYGGGEIASVARYKVAETVEEATAHGVAVDMPYVLESSDYGHCVVTIGGYAEIGPDNMKMYHSEITDGTDKPDDYGHVFGAGRGVLPKVYAAYGENNNGPRRMVLADDKITSIWQYFANEEKYFEFIRTLALATETEVTIGDHAFIKGSVYGGSENGIVQFDTYVTIQDHCQIGQGKEITTRYEDYTDGNLFELTAPPVKSVSGSTAEYYDLECASWDYGSDTNADGKKDLFAPYDPNANATGDLDKYPAVGTATAKSTEGGRRIATDGHTYYGNVFGGGSGSVPYFDTTKGVSRYIMSAGWVKGNTNVTISGGHILTNVYGGNEATNVDGTATITMTDGTIGVPRTLQQIVDHPVTCYLFGAGKGDQRIFFNKDTNVKDVVVNITGGRIFGSVFGGGEDGHVLRDVTMTIGTQTTTGEGAQATTTTSGPTIGTWGTSYVDGNVFGGGRGFGGDAYTAGNVAGSVTMNINGGTMLGSIYGGGRLGSVGYGLFDAETNGQPTPGYGEMRADTDTETGFSTTGFFTKGRGHIDITISGGTIGNDYEYIVPNSSNMPNTITQTDISKWTSENWATWKAHNHIPKTEFDASGRLTHTKGGNVFAGGMGRQTKLDGQTLIDGIDWWKLGCVKQTKLTITGGHIKSNVYGGGELGAVIFANGSTTEGGTTEINISGSADIGTPVTESVTTGEGQSAQTDDVPRYTFGSVFGGGMGSENDTSTEEKIGGLVAGSTKITMTGGDVKASVYGGGELAIVQGSHTAKNSKNEDMSVGTEINISGGTIGYNQDGFGGATMGNVYGGGKGSLSTKEAGLIKKNTLISISGGNIYHNVYGGGAYGSVGTFTYETPTGSTQPASTPSSCTDGTAWVTISGGTIGINGHDNGMVFGSSRGDVAAPDATGEDPNNKLAWASNTYVTIGTTSSDSQTTPWIRGSVYGSGENGHVLNNTNVAIHSGKIGIETGDNISFTSSGGTIYTGAEYGTRGNVYGGGCGTDTYDVTTGTGSEAVTKHYFNRSAGVVRGNATITMDGGRVVRSIYGGGAMGSVGRFSRSPKAEDDPYLSDSHVPGFISSCAANTGLCSVTISGGQVGPDDTTIPDGAGNVFGASRGEIHYTTLYPNLDRMAYVDNTEVSIGGTATIKGSVYGGGETGNVLDNTEVNVCAEKQTSGETVTYVVSTAEGTPTIGGNVYGGGKGVANSFTCSSAMVGLVDQGVTVSGTSPNETYTLLDGGTNVRIYNGTVGTLVGTEGAQTLKAGTGNVYGGGEIARVERNTVVEIGAASGSSAPEIRGSVFAAGAGKATHGYSALVRGHSSVTVQGGAQVWENVFGGGELASVGRYKVKTPANANQSDVPSTLPLGMPARLLAGGTSTVNILGSATIGTAGNDETGHVYGAGQGLVPSYAYNNKDYTRDTPYATRIMSSKRMVAYTSSTAHPDTKQYKEWDYYVDDEGNEDTRYVWEYFPEKSDYLQFVETLALSAETFVTIGGKRNETTGVSTASGTPTVKGSVFGGSESGFVYKNTDVKIQGGTVNGDAFGGGLGLESFAEAGRVRWNTNLAISGGTVQGNVYGGGKLGDVGTIDKTDQTDFNYIWRNTDANGNNMDTDHNNTLGNNAITDTNKNTGICTVAISGGTIGLASLSSTDKSEEHGNVFGASRGSQSTWWCEKAIVYATNVTVSGGTVYGTVYGGGEVGRVEDDAKVVIGISRGTGADKPNITGSVFGGGAGLATHGYSALVRGDAAVTVQGVAKVGGNVYGGGEVASVGRFKVVGGLPTKPKGGGTCTVVVKDDAVTGDVYGSCKGVTPAYVASGNDRSKSMQLAIYAPADNTMYSYYNNDPTSPFIWRYYTEEEYLAFLPTLGLASNTHVTIGGNTTVNGSVYGGGQRGLTLGGVDVNITGGTVKHDVYGGGALANSNSSHWHNGERTEYVELDELFKGTSIKGYYTKDGDTYTIIPEGTADGDQQKKYYAIFKTNVNLTGGTVERNVYGGGLGQLAKNAVEAQDEVPAQGTEGEPGYVPAVPAVPAQPAASAIEAKVYGDVLVELNKPTSTTTGEGESATTTTTYGDCEVKGTIFGCNNLNGSPQSGVTVHVYKTVTKSEGVEQAKPTKNTNIYEVTAVYGGGNLAAYYPDDETARRTAIANVIIDGCDLTSIKSVYGGGNAASVPATEVVVNGTYEIDEVFGGGNGKDKVSYDGGVTYVDNPGANVGLLAYPNAANAPYDTKENRKTNYGYGIGKAHATIYGGTVHTVYGGSNTKGNVREESRTTLEDHEQCTYNVGDAFGGGNNAAQDGDAILDVGCIRGLDIAYGGASNADVNGDVILNIINGTYGRVFGGNNLGGAIRGSILVNIEETGCNRIVIGELYCGGNLAPYSVYGYNDDGSVKRSGDNPVADPVLNVKSFTSIGKIFGGGYGSPATMVANPTVNINVVKGRYRESVIAEGARVIGSELKETNDDGYDATKGYDVPSHEAGAIGAIGSVFGGGNEAEVIGNPTVNIGTEAGDEVYDPVTATITPGTTSVDGYYIRTEASYSPATGTAVEGTTYYEKKTVAVDIRDNVFGGGNNAPVTGNTNVVIGKKITTP